MKLAFVLCPGQDLHGRMIDRCEGGGTLSARDVQATGLFV